MIATNRQQGYEKLTAGLRRIGYDNGLLKENYRFADWFTSPSTEIEVAAAAFGQTPISHDTACIGIVISNGQHGQGLVNRCRALGAPVVLEIAEHEVREWAVSAKSDGHGLIEKYDFGQLDAAVSARAPNWSPREMLRAKNIGSFEWCQQLSLFAGLLPELEERIQETLDPLLRKALYIARESYRESTGRTADPTQLFQLVFWLLTAKVFSDRKVKGFSDLPAESEQILEAIASYYNADVPRLLNKEARKDAASLVWTSIDFRNLSVEALAQIWSRTLLDEETKKRLGIHRTSRTIVRYIIDRIPFNEFGDEKRLIIEPCCGSAVFLVGAMNALRDQLFGMAPKERHRYFVEHLVGLEADPFGAEISRLSLTLADFPNPNGWNILNADVFSTDALGHVLPSAGVVLCNPPFGDFDDREKGRYAPNSPKKPVELLEKILATLHPRAVLGFVLPRNFIDGKGYSGIRQRLADRFADMHLTVLPDKAFDADSEICLLVATEPIPHSATRIRYAKVKDDSVAWEEFERHHTVTLAHVSEKSSSEAKVSLSLPELPDIWDHLIAFPTLDSIAVLHRGIEWNQPLTKDGEETGARTNLVRDEPAENYKLGVPPLATFRIFEAPNLKYLSVRPSDQRSGAYLHDWDSPKAIFNKSARSRGPWRLAAFPDADGVVCYQTFTAAWPLESQYDEIVLSAIINSPVANAFVSTREGKTDITIEVCKRIPIPHLTRTQIQRVKELVSKYLFTVRRSLPLEQEAPRILMEIDAVILDGYRMPPKLETKLLSYFSNNSRPTSHEFGNYPGIDEDVFFSLSDRLSSDFEDATAGALLHRMAQRKLS